MSNDTSGVGNIKETGDIHAQIKAAIGVHGLWKSRIKDAIATGSSDWEPTNVAPSNLCDFGKWLNSLPADAKGEHYKIVYPLHADFHKEAARILDLAVNGKTGEAKEATTVTSTYANLTSQLTSAMMKWMQDAK